MKKNEKFRLSHNFFRSPLGHFFICVIFFSFIVLCFSELILSGVIYEILNSDLIYIESLYRDLFVRDFPLNGWLVSRAPYFFPDWFLYFFLRKLTGDYGTAWIFYVFANFFALIGFFYFLIRYFFPDSKWLDLRLSLGWGTLLIPIIIMCPKGMSSQTFIFPVYHSGAFLNGLFFIGLWLVSLRRNQNKIILFLTSAVSAVSMVSDQWWALWFAAPLFLTEFVFFIRKKRSLRRILPFVSAVALGTIIGFLLPMFIEHRKWLYFSKAPLGDGSSKPETQFHLIVNDFGQLYWASPILGLLTLTLVAGWIFRVVKWYRLKKNSRSLAPENSAQAGLQSFVLFSVLVPFVAIIVIALWSRLNFRYTVPLLVFPWVLVGLQIKIWNSDVFRKITLLMPFLITIGFFWNRNQPHVHLLKTPLLAAATCLDVAAKIYLPMHMTPANSPCRILST